MLTRQPRGQLQKQQEHKTSTYAIHKSKQKPVKSSDISSNRFSWLAEDARHNESDGCISVLASAATTITISSTNVWCKGDELLFYYRPDIITGCVIHVAGDDAVRWLITKDVRRNVRMIKLREIWWSCLFSQKAMWLELWFHVLVTVSKTREFFLATYYTKYIIQSLQLTGKLTLVNMTVIQTHWDIWTRTSVWDASEHLR